MSACLKNETLLAFVDREMASGEMESAERHVSACAACQQELDSIRATGLKVNTLLSSLAPNDGVSGEQIAAVRIPVTAANLGVRWITVTAVGVLAIALVLFALVRHSHPVPPSEVTKTVGPVPVPAVGKKDVVVAAEVKPVHVVGPKAHAKARQFQALDNGGPIATGMIYRVSLPARTSHDGSATQSAKRVPAEVIVDEFGKVRAIRFLQ